MCLAYLGFVAFFHSLFPFIEFSPRVMTCFQIFLVYEWEGCQPCFYFVLVIWSECISQRYWFGVLEGNGKPLGK